MIAMNIKEQLNLFIETKGDCPDLACGDCIFNEACDGNTKNGKRQEKFYLIAVRIKNKLKELVE